MTRLIYVAAGLFAVFPVMANSEDAALNGSVKDFKVSKDGNAKVSIPSNGGFVIAAKPAKLNRPIIQTSYTADPAPMVHDGTVYLYTSHDEDDADGFKMLDWLLYMLMGPWLL